MKQSISLGYLPQGVQYQTQGEFSNCLRRGLWRVKHSDTVTFCCHKIYTVHAASAARHHFQASGGGKDAFCQGFDARNHPHGIRTQQSDGFVFRKFATMAVFSDMHAVFQQILESGIVVHVKR